MIRANKSDIIVYGSDDEVVPEFLSIYKIIEANFKKNGHNFRSLFMSILFDKEFEEIQAKETKIKRINFNDILKK